jgi:hypothetical protein
MPVSSKALCSRWASRLRSAICVRRYLGQQPQVTDRLGRHKARAQQAGFREPAQPRRIGDVGLATGDLLDVAGVDEHQLELVLKQMPDRLPIVTGGLHHDMRHAVRLQPVAHHQQPTDRGGELLDVLHALAVCARHANARRHLRLVHVQRALTLHDHIHPDLPLDDNTTVARTGPRKQTSLRNALTAAGPGSGRGPHVKLNHGLKSTKKKTTSANDAPHHPPVFTRPQAAGEAGEEN